MCGTGSHQEELAQLRKEKLAEMTQVTYLVSTTYYYLLRTSTY